MAAPLWCTRINERGPWAEPPTWGAYRGAAPPTRRRGNPINADLPLRMVASMGGGLWRGGSGDCDCASVFSDNKSLSGQWLLIWTRMENQSIQSSFVCLVISFWFFRTQVVLSAHNVVLSLFSCFHWLCFFSVCIYFLNIWPCVGQLWLEKHYGFY